MHHLQVRQVVPPDLSDLSLTDPDAGARRQELAAVEDGAIPEGPFLASQRASPP
jgi:hypothetical protein